MMIGIGNGWARCNGAEIVADDVRQNQGAQGGCACSRGQPAALDAIDAAAHGVDVVDGSAARQELLGELLEHGQSDPWGRVNEQC